jgi:hypothetical protein
MPLSTPRGKLVRHASVSSLIELSGSRSEDSPRPGISATKDSPTLRSQSFLAQALPSPLAAYVTDMQTTCIIKDLNRLHQTDTLLASILRNISVSTTHDPLLINEAYKIFTSITAESPVAEQRKHVYQFYNSSLQSAPATRLVAWKEYQTTIMAAMNNRLQNQLPGVITKETNALSIAFDDPMPTTFTPEQTAYLHQYMIAYAYMLGEQERIDPDLFGTLHAHQMSNYPRFKCSLEQQKSALPLVQSLLKPLAIGITDMRIADIIEEHDSNGPNILTKVLRTICIAELKNHEQVHNAHAQFMSIIEQRDIAMSRKLAHQPQPQIAMRSECWQGYHIAVMMQLNKQLTKQIPTITTDPSKLYVAFMGLAPVTFSPEQANLIIKYILVYAVMLSELEATDLDAFKHIFINELPLLKLNQPSSPKMTLRKHSGGGIGSFSSLRGLFKKGDGASSSSSS